MAEKLRYTRNNTIDISRFICFCFIVLIHTADKLHFQRNYQIRYDEQIYSIISGQIIDQISRFSVPFYFTAAGYFFAVHDLRRPLYLVGRIALRLLPAYAVWVAIYNIADQSARGAVVHPGFWLRLMLQGGVAPHLWYLPSLALCLVVLIAASRLLSVTMQWVLALLLYMMGLLIGSYCSVIFGYQPSLMQLHIARDAAFFGFAFVFIGFWLAQTGRRPSFKASLAIFLSGGVLHLSEAWAFVALGLRDFSANDYLIGTLPFGIGAFLVALTWPYSRGIPSILSSLGRYGLGLYAIHIIFVNGLGNALQPRDIGARLLIAGMTIILSLLVVIPLAQVPRLRPFLM